MARDHHNIPYRPPRDTSQAQAGSMDLYLRFFRRYLLPHRVRLLLCVALMSLNACSVYLMAYYGRVVVDQILVVQPVDRAAAGEDLVATGISARDRRPRFQPLREHGGLSDAAQDAARAGRPPRALQRLCGIFVLFVLTVVGLNVLMRLSQRSRIRVARDLTADLREDLHRQVLKLSRRYHQVHTPGQLMARILSDVDVVRRQMTMTVLRAGSQIIMFVVGVVLLVSLDGRLALIALVAMAPYAWLYRRAYARLRPLNREMRHTNACLYSLVSQKLDAVRAITAYGRERHEERNFHRLSGSYVRDALQQQCIAAALGAGAMLITALTTVLVLLCGSQYVLSGTMTLGRMLYAYALTTNLFVPVLRLTGLSAAVSRLMVVLQRLVHILDEPVEIEDAPDAVAFPTVLRAGIALRHVHFSYSTDSEPVLRDVSLNIPAGQWICLMGTSGAGKTTLLHLMTRLHDPVSGDILVDGTPLAKIGIASLRRHVALVPQEAQIFTGSVRDNITYGDTEASPSRIMAAAQAAECHAFIMELPVQYETLIGEKGSTLSGGQRQRISLARALISQPEVLLLDDCTSALDADTEQRVQATLTRLLQGRTAIIVSQRVSMAMRCNRICVLQGGVITEQGTHGELLAQGGFYARLHAQQTE